MSNFITNSSASNLKYRLIELIEKSDQLRFLVGFFYFSGIRELYEGLKQNPNVMLKILVGLNIDKANFGMIEFADKANGSDEEKRYRFFDSIKKSINTETFDTAEFYEQVKFFVTLIQEDKLIIRKTNNPNHAKLYLFNLNADQVAKRELFITGSSNLTKAGLSTQNEFNVEISDYGFEDASKYFDDLWDDAVRITEFEDVKKKLVELIETDTLVKDITPYEAFCLVLKTYIESFKESEISESLVELLQKNGYEKYQYQLDAVKQARSIIEDYNGVVIADVVGLGKSIIAAALAYQLKRRGVIICPPGLMGDKNKKSGWQKYKEEFRLYDWDVRSLGDLENTLELVNRIKDYEVVIIDEAHRFRNQDTKDYDLLKSICRNKMVILLTATPFNNRPADVLSLLGLFTPLKKSAITFDGDLRAEFTKFKYLFDRMSFIRKNSNSPNADKRKRAVYYYKLIFDDENIDLNKVKRESHAMARQIRNVIEPVTIRRNRLDLQQHPYYKEEVKVLSKVADPIEKLFALTPEQSAFYSDVIENYFGDPDKGGRFKGAIYRPFEYEKDLSKSKEDSDDFRQFQQQRNLYDFMRRMLVKRFESSFGAFEQSIKNFKKITEDCQTFIQKTNEYVLDRALLEKIFQENEDEIEKKLLEYEEKINKGEYPKNHKRYKVDNFAFKKEFLDDIASDIALFSEILKKLDEFDLVRNDPKTACLIEHLKEEFSKTPKGHEPHRKIVIFSEYVDTVKYLERSLKKHYGDRMLVVPGDLSASKITAINTNFDAKYPEQENTYQLLLSSDKISEGFNLNRAGMVINYDIPWNPVRVIQRLGRINRISKKVFHELYIVNFFPTEIGANLVQSREIAANKMFLIHSALGEDAKIFDIDEEPTPSGLFQRIQQNPDALESESFYTKAFRYYLDLQKNDPVLFEALDFFPPRVKVAKAAVENELFVFFKKGRMFVMTIPMDQTDAVPYHTSLEDIFDKIVCKKDEPALEWNREAFWKAYQKIREYREIRTTALASQSLEMKALNNLETLINSTLEIHMSFKAFYRTLREDILDYGTLGDYTLRRISNFKENNIKDISGLWGELGKDYLDKEKKRMKEQHKELIIAIENQHHE